MSFRTGAKKYTVVNQPDPVVWPITVDELKLWAKIFNSAEDALLQQIIEGVTLQAEKYTHRSFIVKEYETKRDVFGDVEESPTPYYVGLCQGQIVPRRSPFFEFVSIRYFDEDGTEQTLTSADVQVADKESFAEIYPAESESWPGTSSTKVQPITVNFKAGYGESADDIPSDLKDALLAHATSVYKNRGDCSNISAKCSCSYAPAEALAVYNSYRLLEFRAF